MEGIHCIKFLPANKGLLKKAEHNLARLHSPVFDNRARGGDYLYSGNETSKLHISAPDHPKIQFSSKYSTPGCPLSNGWCHVVLVYQEGCQKHPSLSSSLLFLPNVV